MIYYCTFVLGLGHCLCVNNPLIQGYGAYYLMYDYLIGLYSWYIVHVSVF
jgi:hypothetical protein